MTNIIKLHDEQSTNPLALDDKYKFDVGLRPIFNQLIDDNEDIYKETYQEIKRISGEELKELLSNLDNVFDLGTGTLLGDSYLASTDH